MPKEVGPEESPEPEKAPDLMALLTLGMYMAVCIGLGVGLGLLADDRLGTAPALTFVGLALGIAAAAVGTYREIRKYL